MRHPLIGGRGAVTSSAFLSMFLLGIAATPTGPAALLLFPCLQPRMNCT